MKTRKCNILLVDLPTDATEIDLSRDYDNKTDYIGFDSLGISSIIEPIPNGTWQILGLLDSLSEEQKGRVCELHSITRIGVHGWKDYVKSEENNDFYTCWNASDSFQSLIDSYGVTSVNKTVKPKMSNYGKGKFMLYMDSLTKWQAAEEKTFINPLVLIEYK